MASESKTTILFALGANAAIAAAKVAGGLISGSSALLAEAAHSIADTTNQVLLLVSLSLGRRKPDEEHPFGHGKERFFWAFVVAVMIFVAGGVFSLYHGIQAILGEEHEGGAAVAFAVLGFSLVAESIALGRAVRHIRTDARKQRQRFFRFLRESNDPTVKVVFYEDLAAVTGVVIALVGVGLAEATGNGYWDGIAAIAIGVLLMLTGFEIGRDTKGLLIGEAARPEDRKAMREAILAHDAVDELVELLTMHLGPHSLLVTARVNLRSEIQSDEIERLSDRIDSDLKRAVPDVTEVFLDATPGPSARG